MLRVESVRHRYGSALALTAPDFSLGPNEHAALIGASGSGKTTLLHVLAGILRPSEGRVMLGHEDLYASPHDDRWRAMRVGVVPQRLHLLASVSALDNVRLAFWCVGRADTSAAADALRALGLGDKLDARPSQLSWGQQQRVAIARAMVLKPQLLLADEPTSALDDAHARRSIDVLVDAAAQAGACLVVATHDARVRGHFGRVIALAPVGVSA